MPHAIRTFIAAILVGAAALTPAIGESDKPAPSAETSALCGNGLVDRDETCKSCEADCNPLPCTPSGDRYLAAISLATHPAWEPTAATIHLSYRTNRLSIPGSGSEEAVRSRVDFGASDSGITAFNDLDHTIRIVRAEGKPLPRPLATIELDGCAGTATPTDADLVCVVEGCAGVGGVIEDGCRCEVEMTKRTDEVTAAH
jgi:hypothetical protein